MDDESRACRYRNEAPPQRQRSALRDGIMQQWRDRAAGGT